MENDLSKKIIKLVADHFGTKEENINHETRFISDLKGDSLDVVELIIAVEDNFNVEIDEDSAEKMTTVGALIEFILQKV